MKHWFKVTLYNPFDTQPTVYGHRWEYAENEAEAKCMSDYPGRRDAVRVDPNAVPVVKRGLAEATTEELKSELKSRGWKVTLS